MTHRQAMFYVLTQQRLFVHSSLQHGRVEQKQADFVLKEIEQKLKTLKTNNVVIEELSIPDRVRNCETLVSIFGNEFCEELAELHEEKKEETYESLQMIAPQGQKNAFIYLVMRGHFVESDHTLEQDLQDINFDDTESAAAAASGSAKHKIIRKDGDIACLQNVFKQFADSNLSNLYTSKDNLSGFIKIDGLLLKKQLDKDENAEKRLWQHLALDFIKLMPGKFIVLEEMA